MNIDTPLGRVKVECLKRTLAAKNFELIDVLVSTIVPCVGKTLRVLVREDGAIGFHGSP